MCAYSGEEKQGDGAIYEDVGRKAGLGERIEGEGGGEKGRRCKGEASPGRRRRMKKGKAE